MECAQPALVLPGFIIISMMQLLDRGLKVSASDSALIVYARMYSVHARHAWPKAMFVATPDSAATWLLVGILPAEVEAFHQQVVPLFTCDEETCLTARDDTLQL